jgi:hypothetical protein
MQRFDKFLLSLLKTICGLDITELPGCMLKRKVRGRKKNGYFSGSEV